MPAGPEPEESSLSVEESSRIELVPASRDEEPVLANLLQLYIYDFSELVDVDMGDDGRFVYPQLPLYWNDPGRYPFLVRVDGRLAGFVLVKTRLESGIRDIAEFFVMRRYRRRGVGRRIAHEVWSRFRGGWEVRVRETNLPARQFWASPILSFTGSAAVPVLTERDGEIWQLFSFESCSRD